jgi:hypothetical protein
MTINKVIIIFFLIVLSCISCKSDETNCTEAKIKSVYFDYNCHNDTCGYIHTVMLDIYSDECFTEYDFIHLADKYLDTISNKLPVNGITFVKPFNFQPVYDSRDAGPIRENSIVSIFYTEETMRNKIPEISSVSFWANGTNKGLEYIQVPSRQRRINSYKSLQK